MLVVHAHWSAGASALRLWAEDAARVGSGVLRATRGDRSRVRPHPFAVPVRQLRGTIERYHRGDVRALEEWWAVLLLPTARDMPVPSPAAIGEARAASELTPWRVPALDVAPTHALELLTTLAAARDSGVVVADDVRYLAAVAELAGDVVARGRVVPGLAPHRPPPGSDAAWVPALAGDLRARRDALAVGMPPAVRCLETKGGDVDAPATVLDDALGALVDVAARAALRTSGVRPPRGAAGIADAWIRGLASTSGLVRGDAGTLAQLSDDLDAWARARSERVAAVRLCLRLVAPDAEEPDDAWRIEALLQSTAEPSRTIEAAAVEARPELASPALGTDVAAPIVRIRDELARAAAIHPPLAAMAGGVLGVETPGAYAFLRGAVARLRGAGIGVELPTWWDASTARLGIELVADDAPHDAGLVDGPPGRGEGALADSGLGLDGVVQVDWEVVLGGERIDIEELRRLARAEVPLVRLNGHWVELLAEDVTAAVRLLESGRLRRRLQTRDVLRALLGEGFGADGLPVLGIRARGSLGRLLGGSTADGAGDEPEPAALVGTLRPYQRRGLAWLRSMESVGVGACLADDMGLGKTVQVLALLLAEREDEGVRPGPTLLVCPMSLVENWRREAERFAPSLDVRIHHGAERPRSGLKAAYADADLVLTTYALLARDREAISAVRWWRVVLDEAQAIKNPASAAARAARSCETPRRVALTGTPVENRLAELWSIMEFLNPSLLGAAATFRRRYADPIELAGDERAAERLARVTRPFLLRRLKTDKRIISDLPEKVEMKVYAQLTPEQAALYATTVDDLMARVSGSSGMERRGLVLAALTRLKQICDHPRLVGTGGALVGRSGKFGLLEEILGEVLDIGERALVFTQYAQMGHLLHEHLADVLGREVLYLHGGLDRATRDRIVGRFHEPDGPHVLILSLRAGGQGLNLVAANHVVHVDRWWNPAVEDQATDRAFRIGQTRGVQVRKLIATGTVEERIDRLIERKRALSERIVGEGEAWLTELSNEDLRELVELSTDAVGSLDEEAVA